MKIVIFCCPLVWYNSAIITNVSSDVIVLGMV